MVRPWKFNFGMWKMAMAIVCRILCILLLFAFSLGSGGWDAFHKVLHIHAQASEHTTEHEQDPCHRAIYHLDEACGHSSHVVSKDLCDACDLYYHLDTGLLLPSFAFQRLAQVISPEGDLIFFKGALVAYSSSRAPPVI